MKMKIGAELPDGYEPTHEDLAAVAGTMLARTLLPLFAENMSEDMARANVEAIVTELSYLFDEGEIEIGGKTFFPRLAFVNAEGAALPGLAEMTNLHELTATPFDVDPNAMVTFEDEAE
ncbi:hypothetical protein [Jannaschia pohangensis]|uniref:Uncharacterized protein n=1 Tax=Jannaschia pohangensis TaxID=390807 RepID=A0A1I3IQ76_9RHOB|nr:hypothetical protein [Jannaschia pohangensis]SFI50111.1 hypothetical protein SAMN04488095_1059 [Jannaschia pohangensis]